MLIYLFNNAINLLAAAITITVAVAGLLYVSLRPRFFVLAIKNLWRNPIRTSLIALAITVLVAKVTLIWTVVYFIDKTTQAKSENFKLIITEKWQIPSRMPMSHMLYLDPDSPLLLDDIKKLSAKYGGPIYTKKDFMVWSFFGGTLDPTKKTPKDMVFFFCTQPESMKTMMDDLETLDDRLIEQLKDPSGNGCLLGSERLKMMNKKVGESFTLDSINYKGIDKLEFKILGQLPDVGRYNLAGVMNLEYFKRSFEKYKAEKKKDHEDMNPDRRLNLIWIRVKNQEIFNELRTIIENNSHLFSERPIKVETESGGIAAFMESYKSILAGMKYGLVPVILMIMSLVVAIAISISVRERRSELAVMKVLGFKPNQILNLVLAESLFLGFMSGAIASLLTYGSINAMGGIKFQIAFFPAFIVPEWAFAWGPALGCLAAFLGSILPALDARSVKVSEVFSKVA